MRTCAVVPAAGRGTRLGIDRPKILAPVDGHSTIWDVLRSRLACVADHIHVVVSPGGYDAFRAAASDCRSRSSEANISVSVQQRPTGMGDAVFCGARIWSDFDCILVIWGDQAFISAETLKGALAIHDGRAHCVGLPLTRLEAPYVEYLFEKDRLVKVLETREGDRCSERGLSDVGVFVLSVAGLEQAWAEYCAEAPVGATTGERNLLPFLPFLSRRGWSVRRFLVDDGREARGVNTPEDLELCRSLLGGE